MDKSVKGGRLVLGGIILAAFIALLVGGVYLSSRSEAEPELEALSLEAAKQQLDAGEFERAIEMLTQIVDENKDDAEAYFLLGLAHFNSGDYVEARKAFEHSLELDPSRAAAVRHNLGALAYQLGDMETAVREFEAALEADPDDSDTHYQLGATYLVMSLPADSLTPDEAYLNKARLEFEAALELSPDKPEALVGLGNVHMLLGQTSEAIDTLQTALEHNPEMREALFALGRAYAEAGQPEKAVEALQRFVDTDPPGVWAEQARMLMASLEP